nr:hypothetical protein [uncultured Arsenicibacter sp.]
MTVKRERVTTKDLQAMFGISRVKALEMMKQIKHKKKTEGTASVVMVLVDDVVQFTGLARERIKASMLG